MNNRDRKIYRFKMYRGTKLRIIGLAALSHRDPRGLCSYLRKIIASKMPYTLVSARTTLNQCSKNRGRQGARWWKSSNVFFAALQSAARPRRNPRQHPTFWWAARSKLSHAHRSDRTPSRKSAVTSCHRGWSTACIHR